MKLFLVVMALMFSILGVSQECTFKFSGKVIDFHDRSVIVGATIYIQELEKYAVSDENGNFEISKLCTGTYTILFAHIGCENKEIKIDLKSDLKREVFLEHHIENLQNITITGEAPKQTKSGQETKISSETLEAYSSMSLGDALKEVTGVTSLSTGNTIVKPIINGMHSSRIIIMTNGVRLQDQDWGVEHAPNIDVNTAGAITVIKGSSALAYGGDAIAGVVSLKSQPFAKTDSLYGKTIISGQSNGRGGSVHTALAKTFKTGWFVAANGTLKRYGDFEAPDYNLTNTGLKSGAFSVQTGYNSFKQGFEVFYSYVDNEIGILRASHIGNINDLVNAINSQQPLVVNDFSYDINSPRQEIQHHLVKATAFKRLKGFGKIEVQYDYQNNQRFEYDVRIGDNRNNAAVDLNLQTHSILAELRKDSNLDRIYTFGLMGRYQNNFANPETGVRRLIPDYDKYDFGAFLTTEWKLIQGLIIDAGIRYDFNRIDAQKFYRTSRWTERGYNVDFADIVVDDLGTQLLTNPVFNYHNISASLGMSYDISTNQEWMANISMAKRAPNPSELFSDGLHHSAARIELGDLRIEQETSYRLSSTYIYSREKFKFMLELFFNHINDYVLIEPRGTEQTLRGAFPVWEYRQTNANLYGADITTNYNFYKGFNLINKTAFIKGYDLDANTALIDVPAIRTTNSVNYTNSEWNNFSSALTSELVFRQNEFPDNNFEQYIAARDEFVLVDVSTPPPAYHLLNWSNEIQFSLSPKTDLTLNLSVNNILNTNYRDYLNRLRYFADDLGRNIILQVKINY